VPKLIPFATFYNDNNEPTEAMVLSTDNEDDIFVEFEKPDAVYGFKTAKINMKKMLIEYREGYSDDEIFDLVQICKDNIVCIREIAKEGKIYASSI
jgi:hypothetical protein